MQVLLLLAGLGFCWGQYNPNVQAGTTSIVHLFEWRWADIALECERYLAPYGFGGVQVSPPNENIIVTDPFRPWWERYQPISYKLCTRSGDENEFRDMVTRCNNVGVHIYVDAVVNHMCGSGGGSGTHSTCGSYFNAGERDFPAVPYSGWDFNDGKCQTASGEIENYGDMYQVRDCRLTGLLDLALEKDYVRSTVAEYMNRLIDIGVAGFRIDAAKHMWPGDIKAFLDQLKDLNTEWFSAGTRPFIYQEVIDLGGEPITGSDYFENGRVTEFKYGGQTGDGDPQVGWRKDGLLSVRMKMLRLMHWGALGSPVDRSPGFSFHSDLLGLQVKDRSYGSWFMLAHPYGFTRVMSSFLLTFSFELQDVNDWVGPPSESDGSTKAVTINEDTTCGNDWVCEHRWRQIRNMVVFRNVVDGEPFSNWWDNDSNQVAFGRGSKGFIVFNNDDWDMNVDLQTGLPAGTYCDVISGDKEDNRCTGSQVYVSEDGLANFQISSQAEDPFMAIHVNAKL
uniref:Alpha-amylase n=1 Tax=Strigops habroptila TaxID=2489341 RepID=A0A672UFR6_STRHB